MPFEPHEISSLLMRLRRLDVCSVSDASDSLGLEPSVTGLIAMTVPRRICGVALTVRLAAGPAPADAPPRHLCTAALDISDDTNVIVIEQRTGIDAAGWGGVLSNAAFARGLSGVIVEGPVRDVDEAAELGFPVYARSATARTARGRIHEAATGEPVHIGGRVVCAGDFVAADRSGAIIISPSDIDRVLATAEQISHREFAMTKRMLMREQPSAVMGASYEKMLETE